MSPQTQLRWTIIMGLLMWIPAAMSMLSGSIDFMRGGLFFVAALVLSYIGIGLIAHLVNSYQHTQNMVARAQRQIELLEQRKAEEKARAQAQENEQSRRSNDD